MWKVKAETETVIGALENLMEPAMVSNVFILTILATGAGTIFVVLVLTLTSVAWVSVRENRSLELFLIKVRSE